MSTADRKVAIVTGAGGGIGAAVCARLAAGGWAVVLADRSAGTTAEAEARCRALDAPADTFAGDVTDADYVRELVAFALRRHGRLDAFVGNAGIAGQVKPLADYPDDAFDLVMNVNVRGMFLCLKHAMPALRERGGSFVATASTSAIRGRANLSAYVASKHAVLGLVRSAALECMGSGVRVNAVLPGPIQTPMIDAINDMAAQHGGVARAAHAAYGRPEDVANTVAFLLSPDASHMNGAALVVDAGSTVA